MPLLNHLNDEYSKTKPFQGINMVVTIHLEAKNRLSGTRAEERRR